MIAAVPGVAIDLDAVLGDTRPLWRDWLADVGRGAPAHAGVTGVIRFDEHGDAINKVVLVGRAAR